MAVINQSRRAEQLIEFIFKHAQRQGQRSGQFLFNTGLPQEAANAIRGTLIDPFYKDMGRQELREWIDNHIIFRDAPGFEDVMIIGIFDGDRILWEAE